MMNLFRRGGGGQWIVAAIATLIIVVFVVEFRTARGPANSSLDGDCAIKVHSTCLGRKEFFASYGLVVPQGVPAKQNQSHAAPQHGRRRSHRTGAPGSRSRQTRNWRR
ncbi:MAG: hypothetical protein QM784_00995 [Polyangiaceae bacterium]